MAKKIKAIKCPQCGSTKATETRTDFYRCNSCKTEFFLDNDDIHIYHTHKNDVTDKTGSNVVYILMGVFGVIFFVFLFSSVFSNHSTPLSSPPSIAEEVKEKVVKWDIDESFGFVNGEKEPMILLIGNRYNATYRYDERKDIASIGVYDAKTSKEISIKAIPNLELKRRGINHIEINTFQDNTTYLIFNKYKLYKFNSDSYQLTEVLPQSFGIPEFESGFSSIEFYSFGYCGDGFKVITNMGKEYYYYPIINKIYKEKELNNSFEKKLPHPLTKTGFMFSHQWEHGDYAEEPIQLVKYTYDWQLGYPMKEPQFGWENSHTHLGTYKTFIRSWSKRESRLITYKDFTPGRTYFSPTVLYSDDKQVLICFRPTLSPEATVSIQLLDAQTGDIKWTIPVTERDFETSKRALATKDDGFIILDYIKYWLIDKEGKTVKMINVRDVF